MASYRFCRTDDIALLVDAYNACRGADCVEPALTVNEFKRDAKELGLWASSCMLAFEGTTPIAVLLGAKRGDANRVHRIAVSARHQRLGHGRHLLESLRQKVAILGPPRLVAEIPAVLDGACRFFERCGFSPYARFVDFVADASLTVERPKPRLVSPATVGELLALALDAPLRSPGSVPCRPSKAASVNRGLAIASDVRVEALVLFRPSRTAARSCA
jgi:GNAT superfamily N-acetyltransferase